MTAFMFYGVYLTVGLIQAILTARYVFKIDEDDCPSAWVLMMTIFTPITSVGLLIYGFRLAMTWLVTYGRKPVETETK